MCVNTNAAVVGMCDGSTCIWGSTVSCKEQAWTGTAPQPCSMLSMLLQLQMLHSCNALAEPIVLQTCMKSTCAIWELATILRLLMQQSSDCSCLQMSNRSATSKAVPTWDLQSHCRSGCPAVRSHPASPHQSNAKQAHAKHHQAAAGGSHVGVLQHQQPCVAAVRLHLGLSISAIHRNVSPHALHDCRVEVVGVDARHAVQFQRVADRAQARGSQALQDCGTLWCVVWCGVRCAMCHTQQQTRRDSRQMGRQTGRRGRWKQGNDSRCTWCPHISNTPT